MFQKWLNLEKAAWDIFKLVGRPD